MIANLWLKIKQKWSKFLAQSAKYKSWQRAHLRITRILTAGTLMGLMGLLLLGRSLAPKQFNVSGLTPVNSELTFANDSGSIKLISQQYNPQERMMVLGFKSSRQVSDSDTLPIPIEDLKMALVTATKQQAKMQVIPTTSNKFTVVIRHLTPEFGAMRLTIKNLTLNSNQTAGANTDDSQTDDQENQSVDFKFKSDMQKVDSSLKNMSNKDFAIATTQAEIKHQNDLIKKHQTTIADAKKIIKTDESNIDSQNKEKQYKTGGELKAVEKTIENLSKDIGNQQDTISDMEGSIKVDQKRINLLNQQILDIQSGKYKLSNDIVSSQSKDIN